MGTVWGRPGGGCGVEGPMGEKEGICNAFNNKDTFEKKKERKAKCLALSYVAGK